MKKKIDWAAYNESLKQRGSLTFWVSDEALDSWEAKQNGKRGAQPKYTDLAIETSLSLRLVFKQALRQTEGLIKSLFELIGVNLDVPNYSTLSKRGKVIKISPNISMNSNESLVVIIDSTGLKIYGAGEWSETKHGLNKRREWRKLHLTIEESTLEIIVSSLTTNSVGDPTEALNHINQIDEPIDEFIGDGAYDGQSIYDAIADHNTDNHPYTVTVPPPKNAVLSPQFPENPSKRDEHVDFINNNDRTAWEKMTLYHRRLLVENAMGRFKGIIGSVMRSRSFESQKTEATIACKILNKMVQLGTPLRPALNQI